MNRLNQTEHATFEILSVWTFFRFSYMLVQTQISHHNDIIFSNIHNKEKTDDTAFITQEN
jgi:hypothetical protein